MGCFDQNIVQTETGLNLLIKFKSENFELNAHRASDYNFVDKIHSRIRLS